MVMAAGSRPCLPHTRTLPGALCHFCALRHSGGDRMSSFVEFYKRTASVLVQDAGSLGSRPGRAAGGRLEAVCGGAVRLAGLSGKSVRAEARRLAQVQTGLTLGLHPLHPSQRSLPGRHGRPGPILQGAHCGPAFPMLKGRPKAPSL